MRIDPTVVMTLSVGMCGLTGIRGDAQYTPIIIGSVLACAMVVLPTLDLDLADPVLPLASEVQRAVLVHSVAAITTAVCLSRSTTRVRV